MRFDDMLATMLQHDASDDAARAAVWRQLVDLLAQSRTDDDARLERDAYLRLRAWRKAVDPDVRATVARALAGRRLPAALIGFFAEDRPPIAAPLLATALLDAERWIELIPDLPPVARSLLRHRDDLDAAVERALARFGAADSLLAGPTDSVADAVEAPRADDFAAPPPPAPANDSAPAQINDLIERIGMFRRGQGQGKGETPPPELREPTPRSDRFRFETGTDGLMRWIEGAPREALYGLGIASPAPEGVAHGADGNVAGAFRARGPFRDARLMVAGVGPASGDWRISGVPFFDAPTGRFLGYRGTARRPRFDEQAGAGALFGSGLEEGAVHQVMHELRTPLTAVLGFAEMIEHGVLGAAPRSTRDRARAILHDATRLLAAIDDLEAVARLDRADGTALAETVDPAARFGVIRPALEAAARERSVRLVLSSDPDLPSLAIEPAAVDRMFGRLTGAVVGIAGPDEVIAIDLYGGEDWIRLEVDRGETLSGRGEASLLHPEVDEDSDLPDAPVLGLGFSLRLIRRLAESVGGTLAIGARRLTLTLPAMDSDRKTTAGL